VLVHPSTCPGVPGSRASASYHDAVLRLIDGRHSQPHIAPTHQVPEPGLDAAPAGFSLAQAPRPRKAALSFACCGVDSGGSANYGEAGDALGGGCYGSGAAAASAGERRRAMV